MGQADFLHGKEEKRINVRADGSTYKAAFSVNQNRRRKAAGLGRARDGHSSAKQSLPPGARHV